MTGFFMDYKVSGRKIRYLVQYKWTHSLLGQTPQTQRDAAFDMANMCIDVAIWYMKHASLVASKKSVTMEDAKEIHTSLRRAAGVFKMVQKDLLPIAEQGVTGGDLDPKILNAYFHQCTAEAQEVTVARAIEMQHNSNLISCLANETSKMFDIAARSLSGLDKNISEQWILYLHIKKCIYQAYAYCYHGKNLLEGDLCGEAIRSLKESQDWYEKALSLCKPYSKVKGPAKPVKPDGHSFFTKVNSSVKLMLEKCERENGFIYHQKVPVETPELPSKATYGLANPEEYNLPAPAPIWAASFPDEPDAAMNQTGPAEPALANAVGLRACKAI
ncbi:UNVERIFIED_CONTAM: hypothetical protein PYX00_006572 [Menopon gallinae]|uniref:BRO1 domain-containing protein n=1 Tax=Menopon gallinae TaxID=328185 RepID=A0AAW2HWQ8_9NEOP